MTIRLMGAMIAFAVLLGLPTAAPSAAPSPASPSASPSTQVVEAAVPACVSAGGYIPPTAAAVADPFRPPASPYGPGNRGIEYATAAGDDVRAIGAGVVSFAGLVGAARYVTVAHVDGLRSSYSYLGDILVTEGMKVASGDLLGRAGGHFQLGVRCGADYLDPASLFSGDQVRWRARLVPDDRFPAS